MKKPKNKKKYHKKYPIYGSSDLMKKKTHGTSDTPVQENLRWGCDRTTADRICNYNRHYSEHCGYFKTRRAFLMELQKSKKITFFDSNTGLPLFEAPKNRTWEEFLEESKQHGWPSFRDNEVIWQNVCCLRGGEIVSLAGTHLGHNLPDKKGNRYCINLVSIAGRAVEQAVENAETAPDR